METAQKIQKTHMKVCGNCGNKADFQCGRCEEPYCSQVLSIKTRYFHFGEKPTGGDRIFFFC